MVKNIRDSEQCLGLKENKFTDSEKEFKNATRSVVAKRDINPGECLTESNITTMRPFIEDAIPAKKYYETLYKIAKNKIHKNQVILESDVQQ
jgi:sialic acid synthase SpsE